MSYLRKPCGNSRIAFVVSVLLVVSALAPVLWPVSGYGDPVRSVPSRPGAVTAPAVTASIAYDHPWWEYTRMDKDGNGLSDELDRFLEDGTGIVEGSMKVIVDFDHMPGREDFGTIAALGGRTTLAVPLINAVVAELPAASVPLLPGAPGVVMCEANGVVEATLDGTVPSIAADTARSLTGLDGSGITICILDSGIDPGHPSLDDLDDDDSTVDPKIVAFYDALHDPEDESGNATPYDDYSHGTHVASIAAGTGDGNPAGKYVGVAPGARLVGVKILDHTGKGTLEDELRGLQWAINNSERYSIDIFSCSFGHRLGDGENDGTSAQARLCDRAVEKGIVVVVACGNSGGYGAGSITTPGDAKKVISVGNVKDDHILYSTSSRGPTADGRIKPDVCAPGKSVHAAKEGSDGFTSKTGTSMAAPHVSGIAALMLQANPALRPCGIAVTENGTPVDRPMLQILHETSEHQERGSPTVSPNNDYGWGVVNARAAVARALDLLPPGIDGEWFVKTGTAGDVSFYSNFTKSPTSFKGEDGNRPKNSPDICRMKVECPAGSMWEGFDPVNRSAEIVLISGNDSGVGTSVEMIEDGCRGDDPTGEHIVYYNISGRSREFVQYRLFFNLTFNVTEVGNYSFSAAFSVNNITTGNSTYEFISTNDAPPSASVLSPAACEIISGETTISWEAEDPENAPLSVDICLYDTTSGPQNGTILFTDLAGTGSISWNSTGVPDGSHYALRILVSDGNHTVFAHSGVFYIENRDDPPAIEIIAPPEMENITVPVYPIEWQSFDEDTPGEFLEIGIEYSDGFRTTVVAENLPDTGEFPWNVSALREWDNYTLILSISDNTTRTTARSGFSVRNGNVNIPPAIEAPAPTGGPGNGVFEKGDTAQLHWNASDPDGWPMPVSVSVEMRTNGSGWTEVVNDLPGKGWYDLSTETLPLGEVQLRLTAFDGTASDRALLNITILPPPVYSLSIEAMETYLELDHAGGAAVFNLTVINTGERDAAPLLTIYMEPPGMAEALRIEARVGDENWTLVTGANEITLPGIMRGGSRTFTISAAPVDGDFHDVRSGVLTLNVTAVIPGRSDAVSVQLNLEVEKESDDDERPIPGFGFEIAAASFLIAIPAAKKRTSPAGD